MIIGFERWDDEFFCQSGKCASEGTNNLEISPLQWYACIYVRGIAGIRLFKMKGMTHEMPLRACWSCRFFRRSKEQVFVDPSLKIEVLDCSTHEISRMKFTSKNHSLERLNVGTLITNTRVDTRTPLTKTSYGHHLSSQSIAFMEFCLWRMAVLLFSWYKHTLTC